MLGAHHTQYTAPNASHIASRVVAIDIYIYIYFMILYFVNVISSFNHIITSSHALHASLSSLRCRLATVVGNMMNRTDATWYCSSPQRGNPATSYIVAAIYSPISCVGVWCIPHIHIAYRCNEHTWENRCAHINPSMRMVVSPHETLPRHAPDAILKCARCPTHMRLALA